MTQMSKSSRPWAGETRLSDKNLVKSGVVGLSAPIYYLAGPPAMVMAMRQALNDVGIDDDDIHSEEFYGY